MITNVRLYECLSAVDYYYLDENGEVEEGACSNLVYTDDNYYLVEWCEGTGERVGVSAMQEKQFLALADALAFYKEMKAKENK